MLALLQRVKSASVNVENETIGCIDNGLLVFLCAEHNDTYETVKKLVDKILKLRVFSDNNNKMNLNLADVNGGLLVVSQFTLAADTSRGNRPSFKKAADPHLGMELYELFIKLAKSRHNKVESGQFAADMQVSLVNDGPVTLFISV